MDLRRSKLNEFVSKENIAWLSEEDNPSVRYYTLTEILDKENDDNQVKAARKAIMTSGVVPRLLEKQNAGGYWGIPEDFYMRSKYKGTVWTLIVLAELGADKWSDVLEGRLILY